jgi:excisionase family DNA binding protein
MAQTTKDPWGTYITNRIANNKNFICFVSGPTGSGKSYASLRLAEKLDPNFSSKQIAFEPLEFVDLIDSDDMKPGSVIIFEEGGVGMNAKQFMSKINQMLQMIFQTFRYKRFVVIINSPYLQFIDKSTRVLFHAEFKMDGIDYNRGVSKVKPYLLQYNDKQNKIYYHNLRTRNGKRVVPVRSIELGKPSDDLITAYEKRKDEWNRHKRSEIRDTLDEKDRKKQQEKQKDDPELISFDEAAKMLHIKKKTLYKWANEGKLNKVKLGESQQSPVRVRKTDVIALQGDIST